MLAPLEILVILIVLYFCYRVFVKCLKSEALEERIEEVTHLDDDIAARVDRDLAAAKSRVSKDEKKIVKEQTRLERLREIAQMGEKRTD
jgi:hypothetical protein